MNFTKIAFLASLIALFSITSFGFGLYSGVFRNVAFRAAQAVKNDLQLLYDEIAGEGDDAFLYHETEGDGPTVVTTEGAEPEPGLIFLAGADENDGRFLRIIDRSGRVIHEWRPDWFEVWGDRGQFSEKVRPKSRQPFLHGVQILDDASVVYNFSGLSTVRTSICGEVQWALENYGHHSIQLADDGHLWVSGRMIHEEPSPKYRNQDIVRAETIQQISLDGELIREIDIYDIFVKNDLLGLLYMSSVDDNSTFVKGDIFHLNDVDVYPSDIPSSVFSPGDVMISLRNINALLVVDPDSLDLKFISIGHFLRQHDPDFVGDDKITVFDNRNLWPSQDPEADGSRVVEIDARTGAARVAVDGRAAPKFLTRLGGKQQRLAGGGHLVTSSLEGRVLEVDRNGALLWELQNRLADGRNGVVGSATLLPPEMDEAFFQSRKAACG